MSTILTGIGAAIASVIPFVGLKRQSGDDAHIQQGNVPDPFLELPHEPVTDEDLENEWSRWKEMRETRSVKQAEVSCLNETKPVSVSVPKPHQVSVPAKGIEIIYFLESGDRVKIGFTTDTKERISALSTASPVPLKLIGTVKGGMIYERQLHKRFAAYRRHGEWFKLTPELRAEIEGILNRYPDGLHGGFGEFEELSRLEKKIITKRECLAWVREIHGREGKFPTASQVKEKFNISKSSASRYVQQIKSEVQRDAAGPWRIMKSASRKERKNIEKHEKRESINWIKGCLSQGGSKPDHKMIMQQFSVSKATAYRYLRQAETEIASVSQHGMEVVSCETAKEAA